MICCGRPESDRSATTVSAKLGGQVSMRDALHCTPFSLIETTAHYPFSSSYSSPSQTIMGARISGEKLGAGKTLWATASSFGQKLHSLLTQGTQEFALDT
ncbi:unnamed protein product [Urochloa humidicola]